MTPTNGPRPISLPAQVQRHPDNKLVDPKSLTVGEQFVFQKRVWTILEVKGDGIECKQDPSFFQFP
jgi:hypothetical protein